MTSSLSTLNFAPLQRFSANLWANFISTLLMLIGSKKAFYWVKPTLIQFFVFAVLALLSNVLFSWLSAEETSHINIQGMISYLVWPTLMLIVGLILAKRHYNGMLVLVPVIWWLSSDSLLALIQSFIQILGQYSLLPEWSYAMLPTLFAVLFIWQSLALLWVFGQQLNWTWLERILIMLGAVALLTVWQINVHSQPIFKLDTVEPTISEQAFYQQPQLFSQALTELQFHRPTTIDWYFLGVAGYAEQDVFRSEIMQTKDFFDTKFTTQGRSVALINNPWTLDEYPIASKTSIEQALQQIGAKMNPEEDVLFLSLSSHGGDKELEMNNKPLDLANVEARWLRQALDKSGIKWRVIVISACYSGSFIEDLQSPTTLVITASAKDKQSFGCTNEAEYTYFGQAFFAESLRRYTKFRTAFDEAVISINQREQQMGFEPSEPQFVIGDLMKQALPKFEQSLVSKTVNIDEFGEPTMPDTNNHDNADKTGLVVQANHEF